MAKLMVNRKAFTLIEVLISIALLGFILVPLFSVVEMMRDSNERLLHSLENSKKITKATKVLFLDIMSSDGNFTIKKDEFSRFCIEETTNTLYSLPVAKVCWIVLKEKNTLVRAEGNAYSLPLRSEDRVEVDHIMTGIEIFDIYRQKGKDKVLVVIKQKEKEAISFLVQGIYKPKPAAKKGKFLRDAKGNIIYGRDGVPRREGDGKGPARGAVNNKGQRVDSRGNPIANSNNTRQRRGQNISNGRDGQPSRQENPNNRDKGRQPKVVPSEREVL